MGKLKDAAKHIERAAERLDEAWHEAGSDKAWFIEQALDALALARDDVASARVCE